MTSPTKWTQWNSPPATPIGNVVYRVQLMLYRSADNVSGSFDLYLNVANGFMRFDLTQYTAGEWTKLERVVITSTGVPLNTYGWVYLVHGYWGMLNGGYALVSDIRVLEGAAPQASLIRSVSSNRTANHDDIGTRVGLAAGVTLTLGAGLYDVSNGSWFEVYNNSASNAYIGVADGVTLRLAGSGTTGTRTLAQYALVWVNKVNTTEWVIGGWGVT